MKKGITIVIGMIMILIIIGIIWLRQAQVVDVLPESEPASPQVQIAEFVSYP